MSWPVVRDGRWVRAPGINHEEGLVGVVGRTNGQQLPVSLERAEGMRRDFGERHRRRLPVLAGFAPT